VRHDALVETRQLVAAIAGAENDHAWDQLGELFDEHVTIVHPGLGPVVGRESNIAVMKSIVGAIDGYVRSTENLVVDGDSGAFRFTITGTHTGDLPGYPATRQPVEISGAMFFRVRAGLLAEATELLNHDSTRNLSLR
jgi:predicted ester cyclase